jgi:ubiquitin-conjugating enzyme E2 D/E
MINYHKDAHPFVKIFPCDNDVSFWKVVLLGPEDTPYFGGVYTLYIRFPHTFPTQPP